MRIRIYMYKYHYFDHKVSGSVIGACQQCLYTVELQSSSFCYKQPDLYENSTKIATCNIFMFYPS